MNATRIIDIFKRASLASIKTPLANIKTPLGRWNMNNHRETMLKIKYANEDNCGISGNNYKNTNKIQQNNEYNKNQEFDDNLYIYSMGYDSLPDTVYVKCQNNINY